MGDLRRSYGPTHALAECLTCGWATQSYKNAQALAARHAQAYGHKVSGEVAYAFTYEGDPKPKRTRKQ